jgi:hypothetical protein
MFRHVALGAVAVLLLGISWGENSAAPAPVPAPTEPRFHAELKKIAGEYLSYGRVDDEMRWAPYLCRMPMPGTPRLSGSKDEKTHGQKLYSLFVKNRFAYLVLDPARPIPVGQAIVKQSWIPEDVTEKRKDLKGQPPGDRVPFQEVVRTPPKDGKKAFPDQVDHFWPYARKGDKVFKAAKQADLFIMMKLDPQTLGTDNGWVYGTVTPDGKTVTSAGRVESCMKCHQETKTDRLFGLRH